MLSLLKNRTCFYYLKSVQKLQFLIKISNICWGFCIQVVLRSIYTFIYIAPSTQDILKYLNGKTLEAFRNSAAKSHYIYYIT